FNDAFLVDRVARETDDVDIKVNRHRIEVLVTQHDVVTWRRETGDGGHRQVGEDAIDTEYWQDRIERPEARRVLRGDQLDPQVSSPFGLVMRARGQIGSRPITRPLRRHGIDDSAV